MNLEERIMDKLDRHRSRWLPLSSLPSPNYLAERELAMAEKRGEVERREFDGIVAWRITDAG